MTQIASGTSPVVLDGGGYSTSTLSFPYPDVLVRGTETETGPKTYLNYLVYEANGNFLLSQSGYDRLSGDAREHGQDVTHDRLHAEITIAQAGYVYVYLSNEETSPVEVYFDDFKVEQIKSPVVQADDYYPFGLTYNSYKRENNCQNNRLFNGGSELQTDLNLGFYSTLFRTYDPSIGRFMQIDPLADFFTGISPYNFAIDNPVLFGDPSGLSPANLWQRIKAFFHIGRLKGSKGHKEYVKPVARNRGEPQPYLFPRPTRPPTPPKPKPKTDPIIDITITEPEIEEDPIVSIDITMPTFPDRKVRKLIKKVKSVPDPTPIDDPKPDPLPFGDIPPGGLRFNAYHFEARKSDLYHTQTNDKLISDLITVLKSSSSIHLEIQGNFDEDPPGFWSDPFGTTTAEQQSIANGRAQAIYRALRAAGIPESQLKITPGVIQSTKGRSNQGANVTTTFIITKQ